MAKTPLKKNATYRKTLKSSDLLNVTQRNDKLSTNKTKLLKGAAALA